MSFWVYILRCSDASYYTGHTDNLDARIGAHELGEIPGYTATRRPVKLVFSQEIPTREEALSAERKIKGWSRAKKEAMMRGDWTAVSALAKSRAVRPSTGSGRTEMEPSSGQMEMEPSSGRTGTRTASGRTE